MIIKNTLLAIVLCALSMAPSTHTVPSDYRVVRYGAKAVRITWHTAQTAIGGSITPVMLLIVLYKPIKRFLLFFGEPQKDSLIRLYLDDAERSQQNSLVMSGVLVTSGITTLHAGLKGLYKELEIEAALKIAREKIQNRAS